MQKQLKTARSRSKIRKQCINDLRKANFLVVFPPYTTRTIHCSTRTQQQ